MSQSDFAEIYARLRAILTPYADHLHLQVDEPENYSLETEYSDKWKKPIFFGSAAVKKNYISYYLMPVYMFPELLDDISPELHSRMQGKSCFNFKKDDPALFSELAALTRRGFERFKQEGLVK